jgi:endoglucanase
MKSFFALLIASPLLALSARGASENAAAFVTPAGFTVKRGVNLSHWLSQCFSPAPKSAIVSEKDIRFIARIGYDFVRIPIDEEELWTKDGKPSPENFACLTNCLDWCAKYRLRAIVDLHILRAHHFNAGNGEGKMTLWTDPAAQENFLRLWRDISARLKSYPVSQVAYELLNEPVAPDPEDWNRLIARGVQAIRQLEPDRVIVIGPNRWQIPSSCPVLKVPAGDPNLMLGFHTYSPLLFTHHLASWTSFKDFKGPVHYPGRVVAEADMPKSADTNQAGFGDLFGEASQVFNKQKLLEIVQPAIEKSRELKLPVMCGEFGCLPTVERSERMQYYSDIISVFEENGIAWCNWEYKGDFGIRPLEDGKSKPAAPDKGFIDVLMRKR